MQTGRRGVKAAVIGDGLPGECVGKGFFVGGDVNQPPPVQFFPQGGEGGVVGLLTHDTIIWPWHAPQAISAVTQGHVETSRRILLQNTDVPFPLH